MPVSAIMSGSYELFSVACLSLVHSDSPTLVQKYYTYSEHFRLHSHRRVLI